MKKLFLPFLLLLLPVLVYSQGPNSLVPANTATHTAVLSGNWFNPATWNSNTVPGDAAIVVIPSGINVTYEGQSAAHIFAIRVDGTFTCQQTVDTLTSTLTFDTFVSTMGSTVRFVADDSTDGKLEINISPFDIEAHKTGSSGYSQVWNANALAHYSDGLPTWEVSYSVGPDSRFNSYADALNGNTTVTETSRNPINDGPGVLGRYAWDSTQISLGIVTMGTLEINGQPKQNMIKLGADALKNQNQVVLSGSPAGWEVGDEILITRGGNQGSGSNGEDTATIATLNGNQITCTANLNKNHEGRPQDTLHCYVGNLTRNIVFRSTDTTMIHRRGHMMAMHNPMNVQIRNAAFIDMGRTNKSRLTDDFVWDSWVQPLVFKSKISALGQECAAMRLNPAQDITNPRGRYSIHLHKLGAANGTTMAQVTGNVVRRNPGWGITHHDSHANVSENVVFDVTGSGIVSETGSETGFWDNNLVVSIRKGHNTDVYEAALFHDDYLYLGQGLGMKGRGVICRGNVIANANQGVGVVNMNPSTENLDRMDAQALANRPGFQFDQFPLSQNGYSVEGDGVMPVEVALIMENTTVIGSYQGLRSIERDMGVNHESRSVFDGFKCWGVNQGLSITYQADYTFRNVFISGKNMNSVGCFLWKHSHNHVFENIKMVDLGYGITVSKLVESGNGQLKTRNNGFTPWYFIDLVTDNVPVFYQILKEDPNTTTVYNEHGDNPIHLSSTDLLARPTTFTILDSTELAVDVAGGDLRFEVDGVITDDLGSYDMGIKQAWSQGTLRLDYPERLYAFASQQKFEQFLATNGVYKDTANNDQLYFILTEYLPNRRNWQYTGFPVRININNAPQTGVFANPLIESPSNFAPRNQMVSRFASVSQSSTDTTILVDTIRIDAGAWKAVDGNNNGRKNAQQYQRGLVPVGSFSATETELEPWYDLDLGELKTIDYIDIWNTVELNGADIELLSTHFHDFYVLISDSAFGNMGLSAARNLADYEYLKNGTPTRKFSLNNLNATGRYVRIQAIGTNKIQQAEVEVIGRTWEDTTCNQPRLAVDVRQSCDSLTWINGITYYSNNFTAKDTLVSAEGCDSIVTLNLTLTHSTTATDVQTACDDFVWIDGNTYTSSNNTATHTLQNAAGCDSVVTLNLTVNQSSTATDVQTACDAFVWIDGNTYTSSNNTATHTLQNAAGCDSVVTLNLTLDTLSAGISAQGQLLIASPTGASYQWVDCNLNQAISGANGPTYNVQSTGDYAVIVSSGVCTDTSGCVFVQVTGMENANPAFQPQLYPNPNAGTFRIKLNRVPANLDLQVFSMDGKRVHSQKFHQQDQFELKLDLSVGRYLVVLTSELGVASLPFEVE